MNSDYSTKTPEELIEMIKYYRYDALTGMKQRKDFEIDFERRFYETKEEFFLVMVDVNNLHNTNRDLGYQAGDDLIRRVANIVKFYCMSSNYRYGGDEFMIIKTTKPDMSHVRTDDACFAYVSSKDFTSSSEMLKAVDANLTQCKIKFHKENDRRSVSDRRS